MRVARTTTNGTPAPARQRGRAGARSFGPAEPAAGGGAAVAGTGGLASIAALAALQGVDGADANGGAAAGIARGAAVLDDLEALRDGLLAGALDDATLRRLQARLGDRRRGRLPSGLEAVLDDIELRAAVELAKREPADRAAPPDDAAGGSAAAAAVRARMAYGGTASTG